MGEEEEEGERGGEEGREWSCPVCPLRFAARQQSLSPFLSSLSLSLSLSRSLSISLSLSRSRRERVYRRCPVPPALDKLGETVVVVGTKYKRSNRYDQDLKVLIRSCDAKEQL